MYTFSWFFSCHLNSKVNRCCRVSLRGFICRSFLHKSILHAICRIQAQGYCQQNGWKLQRNLMVNGMPFSAALENAHRMLLLMFPCVSLRGSTLKEHLRYLGWKTYNNGTTPSSTHSLAHTGFLNHWEVTETSKTANSTQQQWTNL